MANLVRWDPFREMALMRNAMNRMFDDDLFPLRFWQSDAGAYDLALDVSEQNDSFVVKASVPGVKPEDIDITLRDNVLTIQGEIKEDEKLKQEQYRLRERRYGSFMRTVTLPSSIDSNKAEAHFENGVLTLTLPKSEESKAKHITVKGTKTIEARRT